MSIDIDTPKLRARLAELLAQYGIPSAAIGVLRDGERTEFAVGVTNVETQAPASTDTVYQVGSMTKTWTALAFLQLADESAVDLDEPVRTYLPDFAVADTAATTTVTPRHLLHHTGGSEEAFGHPGEGEDVLRRMVENIVDAPQVFPVGHTHGYSAALGYAILARIMEVVDGKSWDDVLRDRLFTPMGLRDTNTWREQVDAARAATGHLILAPESGPVVTPVDYLPRAFGPGGGITSTIGEVLTLAHVLLNEGAAPNGRRVVSAEAIREMMQSRVPVPDPYMFGPYWALGLIVCDWHGQTVYASDGSTIGQNARLRLLPDSNAAVAMLTNGGPREGFYRAVFNAVLAGLGGAVTIPDPPTPDPSRILDPARYEGVYGRDDARYEVAARDGSLHLTVIPDPTRAQILGRPDRVQYELLPIDDTHFLAPPADPRDDAQTLALYDFADGSARYLHTNCRVYPRIS